MPRIPHGSPDPRGILAVSGLAVFAGLLAAAVLGALRQPPGAAPETGPPPEQAARLRLLGVGDVNLGRRVGQILLGGDTLYPFRLVHDSLRTYDLVFANLESVLSDRGGETESPHSNMVFTGPPAGAPALRLAGIGAVSLANNHALDYGPAALDETRRRLEAEGIAHTGTVAQDGSIRPALIERNGIRIALFGATGLMNGRAGTWHRFVVPADTGVLLPVIRQYRDSADVLCLSYHGGTEYADRPDRASLRFMHVISAAGVQLVLGHHPHVPYGVELLEGRLIVQSLGNFVFRQPSRTWTQRGLAVAVEVAKESTGVRLSGVRVLPVRAGFQPEFLPAGSRDADSTLRRVARWSRGVDLP